jgi:transcriptional regulator with XRE-family HTH domain
MPRTLGEHVRRHRLELKLSQREAASQLGVNPWTVLNWEKGHTEPPIAALPAIVRFLGYDPLPEPRSLPERLLAKRRAMGWSIKEAARRLRIDEGTWAAWETGRVVPWRRYGKPLDAFLNRT